MSNLTVTPNVIGQSRPDLKYSPIDDDGVERGYVSKLWARDWDSAEDCSHDPNVTRGTE